MVVDADVVASMRFTHVALLLAVATRHVSRRIASSERAEAGEMRRSALARTVLYAVADFPMYTLRGMR